jgi:hypothetical protein
MHWISVQARKTYVIGQLATAWTVRGSNPGKAKLSVAVHTDLGAHPASYMIGKASFSRV